jgi:hypothetical protein
MVENTLISDSNGKVEAGYNVTCSSALLQSDPTADSMLCIDSALVMRPKQFNFFLRILRLTFMS